MPFPILLASGMCLRCPGLCLELSRGRDWHHPAGLGRAGCGDARGWEGVLVTAAPSFPLSPFLLLHGLHTPSTSAWDSNFHRAPALGPAQVTPAARMSPSPGRDASASAHFSPVPSLCSPHPPIPPLKILQKFHVSISKQLWNYPLFNNLAIKAMDCCACINPVRPR